MQLTKNRWFRVSAYVLGGILAVILILFVTIQATSTPTFCKTCHYMRPYVKAWSESKHKDVTCIKCHFPPGIRSELKGKFTAMAMVANYVTGIYKRSKPWAEIEDASCLRSGCHETRLLKGKVQFKEGIIFDHTPHLTKLRRGKKLRCTSCHSQIVQGEHISVTESTCFLCHFKRVPESSPINNCTWCHQPPVAEEGKQVSYDHTFVLKHSIDCQKCHGKMQVGDGAVPKERCSSCHAEIDKLARYSDTKFIHLNHVTNHKVECQSCHLVIQHKSVARTKEIMPACSNCHERPHIEQLSLFTGEVANESINLPNPMFEAGLNCQGCHIYHQNEEGSSQLEAVTVAKPESCEKCHGKGYARLFDNWEKAMRKKVELVDQAITRVNQEYQSSGKKLPKVAKLLKKAEYDFHIVKNGNVVHNVILADSLLARSMIYLRRALNEMGSRASLPSLKPYGKRIPGACRNCHYGQEGIKVNAFGIDFSHDIHINKNRLSCFKCHSNRQRHGEVIISREGCLSCHHTQSKVTCQRCHTTQTELYEGKLAWFAGAQANPMAEEEVACEDCHLDEEEKVMRPTTETCSNCHDEESYGTDMLALQGQVQNKLLALEQRLKTSKTLSPPQRRKLQRILDFLVKDGSNGVHNPDVTKSLLKQAGM